MPWQIALSRISPMAEGRLLVFGAWCLLDDPGCLARVLNQVPMSAFGG
jgi:hypothetical protein